MSTEVITAVALYIIVNVVVQATLKQMTDVLPRTKAMLWQFIIALAVSLHLVVLGGKAHTGMAYLPIVVVGGINALGSYCQWRAYAISLSKSVLFMPLSGVISATLAAAFLGETFLYHSGVLVLGVTLLYTAAILLAWRRPTASETTRYFGWLWLGWVLLMVSIFGTSAFMIKGFTSSVPMATFLVHWYVGACLSSCVIFLFTPGQSKAIFKKRHLLLVLVAGLALWGSRLTHYWAFQVAPLGLVVPFQMFGLSATSILVGWFYFREKEELTPAQFLGFFLGTLGIVAIVMSRY